MATKKKKIMRELEIKEISAVDAPAQEGATADVIKREPIAGEVEKSADGMLVGEFDGHQHSIAIFDEEYNVGETSHNAGHCHPWVRSDGVISVGMTNGHSHAAPGAAGEKVAADPEQEYQEDDNEEIDTMSEKTTNDQKATKMLSLSVEQFAFLKGLTADERDAFIAADGSGRDAAISVAKSANPVVWTDDETGTEYRKSDGDRMIEMAKSASTMRKALRDALAKTEAVELAKRALPVAGNLPGGEVVACAIVQSVEKIADEALRGQCLQALKAGNEAMGMAFKRVGTSSAPVDGGSAEGRYAKAVERIAADRKLSKADAEIALLSTSEGSQLYSEMDHEIVAKRAAK